MYKVKIEKSALKSLTKIPSNYLVKIRSEINSLEKNPRPSGCKKLGGSKNKYRIRIGFYRVIYTINDDVLTVKVVKVDNRDCVYKDKK
jgi:mRNA interferase RelE/StbE